MILDTALHKNTLIRILKDIYTDTTIGPFLGFKGGTAAYFLYGLNRFSVDLDFDLLDESKADYVFEKMSSILAEYGIIKQADQKRYTIFFRLTYKENNHSIKVDINRRNFGSHYEVKSYLGIAMKVMVREDMTANKMVAMVERTANRDIFDTYFFLHNNWPVNERIIEQRTGLSMHDFLTTCIERLEAMSNQKILSGLGELLDAKQKAWVKSKLLAETIFLLKVRLENYSEQPNALLYSYDDGGNIFDPSDLGSRSYKEYKSNGIYNKPIAPAKAVIHFDKQCSEAFLNKFLHALDDKIRQYISKNSKDKQESAQKLHEIKSVILGQALHFSAYLSKEKFQEFINELNQHSQF